jgi:DNA polymerase III sliding clamp (beta) subunit (PCNA family)
MEFSISVYELKLISKLLGICAKRNTEDPIGRVVIEVQDNEIMFLANDGSVAIQYVSNKGATTSDGVASVVYNNLASFLTPFDPWDGNIGAKEAKFKLIDMKSVNMSIENVFDGGTVSKNKLRLEYHNAYSVARPDSFNKATFILNSEMLKTAINKVVYVINPSEKKEQIQGMNLLFNEDNVYFAGTNGVMLSEYKIKNSNKLNEVSFHVRYDFITALHRALATLEEETQVFIEIDNDKIKAKFGNVYIDGRLNIGRDFPHYKPPLESFTETVVLDKIMILAALDPIKDILDSDDYNRITVEMSDKRFKVRSEDYNFEWDGELDFDGEFIVDVNGKDVRKIIDAIKDEKLLFKFSHDLGPLIFDSEERRNQNTLITPVKRRS